MQNISNRRGTSSSSVKPRISQVKNFELKLLVASVCISSKNRMTISTVSASWDPVSRFPNLGLLLLLVHSHYSLNHLRIGSVLGLVPSLLSSDIWTASSCCCCHFRALVVTIITSAGCISPMSWSSDSCSSTPSFGTSLPEVQTLVACRPQLPPL